MYNFAADYRLNEYERSHFLGADSRYLLKCRACLARERVLGVNLNKKDYSY